MNHKCMNCGMEMEKGTTSFTTFQGVSSMVLSYVSEEESKKGIFKRKSKEKIVLCGDEVETWYCPHCKKITMTLDVE